MYIIYSLHKQHIQNGLIYRMNVCRRLGANMQLKQDSVKNDNELVMAEDLQRGPIVGGNSDNLIMSGLREPATCSTYEGFFSGPPWGALTLA